MVSAVGPRWRVWGPPESGLTHTDSEEAAIEAAQRIIDVVAFYGLTKVDPPEPLLPITEDDVGVVCWMAVLGERGGVGDVGVEVGGDGGAAGG